MPYGTGQARRDVAARQSGQACLPAGRLVEVVEEGPRAQREIPHSVRNDNERKGDDEERGMTAESWDEKRNGRQRALPAVRARN